MIMVLWGFRFVMRDLRLRLRVAREPRASMWKRKLKFSPIANIIVCLRWRRSFDDR
jgi:hypothetical protein